MDKIFGFLCLIFIFVLGSLQIYNYYLDIQIKQKLLPRERVTHVYDTIKIVHHDTVKVVKNEKLDKFDKMIADHDNFVDSLENGRQEEKVTHTSDNYTTGIIAFIITLLFFYLSFKSYQDNAKVLSDLLFIAGCFSLCFAIALINT